MNLDLRPQEGALRVGVGAVSKPVIDAVIRTAARRQRTIFLIASRSQIDSLELGGGYVEGWSTQDFAAHVRAHDHAGRVILCRDHGGPWQSRGETDLSADEAMRQARMSYEADIAAGFGLLHIDTSRIPDAGDRRDALVDLYAHCLRVAQQTGRRIAFELGEDPQSVEPADPLHFDAYLEQLVTTLRRHRLPMPAFIVAQTGTKVVETENAGRLQRNPRATSALIGRLADACGKRGVGLKAHNCDYLSSEARAALLAAGPVWMNIAPEFAVAETAEILRLLKDLRLDDCRRELIRIAFDSGSWSKWLRAGGPRPSTERCALLAAHYVSHLPAVREIRRVLDARVRTEHGVSLADHMQRYLVATIDRYM